MHDYEHDYKHYRYRRIGEKMRLLVRNPTPGKAWVWTTTNSSRKKGMQQIWLSSEDELFRTPERRSDKKHVIWNAKNLGHLDIVRYLAEEQGAAIDAKTAFLLLCVLSQRLK